MKIGVIKETKVPVDNRVAFSPKQVKYLQTKFNTCEFVVQKSDIRIYSDEDYIKEGIIVTDDLSDCDVLFGIKEVSIDSLIPNKHYFFFGHIAKMQPYNRPLIKKMMSLGITFTDYEYLVDNSGKRLCAFGWWAGVVGAYNSLRAFFIKRGLCNLPKPSLDFTLSKMFDYVNKNNISNYNFKIVISGSGKVSEGASYFLREIGVEEVDNISFLNNSFSKPVYTIVPLSGLVKHIDKNRPFDREEFRLYPHLYVSDFFKYTIVSDIFISCHFWGQNDPVYLTFDELQSPDFKVEVIGDVTCDILGSIHSTLRASTHDNPFYDYNPLTGLEEPPFSSSKNITIMAVDTLPNALASDTSSYFGDCLIQHVIDSIINEDNEGCNVINRATILDNGVLTSHFAYLHDYASFD